MPSVRMHWKMWYGNEALTLPLPDHWNVNVIDLPAVPEISDAQILEALHHPIGSPRLSEYAQGSQSVCITIDDITKPTPGSRFIPPILEELHRAGIQDRNIYFLISLGSHHRVLVHDDLVKKLGKEVVAKYRVYNHNPYQNNKHIGETSNGTPLIIDRHFLEADFKVAIGMLMPHNITGFSGGGKIVLPGLAQMESVEALHRSSFRGLEGKIGMVEGNKARQDVEEAAKIAGLNFIANSLYNSQGQPTHLFCGDPALAYEQAAHVAVPHYACEVPYLNDVGIFNAFPRDNWLLLSLSSLDVWSTREPERQVVRKGGSIVIVNACTEGVGEHGLNTKGMKKYVKRDVHGLFKDLLEDRELIFFSPNLNQATLEDYYEKPVLLFHEWEPLYEHLATKYPNKIKAAVFPTGTLQMDKNIL